MRILSQAKTIHLVSCLLIGTVGVAVFWPGASGPFLFDDFKNIVDNPFLQIRSFDLDVITAAAMSSDSGPLKRPLSMLSFALNSYVAGDTQSPYPFKATNIFLHALNGILVYLLLTQLVKAHSSSASGDLDRSRLTWGIVLVALLWTVHPIQMTSVLYVVQRMTGLSATFALLAITSYLVGRQQYRDKGAGLATTTYMAILPILLTTASVLSKEVGLLIPVYILVIEIAIFSANPLAPVNKINDSTLRRLVYLLIVFLALGLVALLVGYAANGYDGRPFTMQERLLTEARVLGLYLRLILLPDISGFALHHDDISISRSLIDPATTLLSVLTVIGLLVIAVASKRRHPLIAFGLLWFLGGHLLESTILPLEIAHEHRNYLPSLGILVAMVYSIHLIATKTKKNYVYALLPLLAILFASVTLLRANQWSSANSLFALEVRNHPNSPRTQHGFANQMARSGNIKQAIQSLYTASKLAPREASYPIATMHLQSLTGRDIDPTLHHMAMERLMKHPMSTSLTNQLGVIASCLGATCQSIGPNYRQWLDQILKNTRPGTDVSQVHYLMGQYFMSIQSWPQAVQHLEKSYALATDYIHPLFLLAYIYVETNNSVEASRTVDRIKQVNKLNRYHWDKHIQALESTVSTMTKTR